jgi:hypothetical protein
METPSRGAPSEAEEGGSAEPSEELAHLTPPLQRNVASCHCQENETTFMSHFPTNQLPTNQLKPEPATYVSMRLSIDHKYLRTVQELFRDVEKLAFVEHGRGTSNEHFHICLPGPRDKGTIEMYRKRIRDKFGGRGNGFCSLKGYSNGLRSFMFYCLHEGTTPRYEDFYWQDIVLDVQEKGSFKKGGKQGRVDVMMDTEGGYNRKDRNWVLTYSNLVVQAVKHRKLARLQTDSLKAVVKDMIKTTKWRPTREMYRNGVAEAYELDFQFAIGVRAEPDMGWWRPRDF